MGRIWIQGKPKVHDIPSPENNLNDVSCADSLFGAILPSLRVLEFITSINGTHRLQRFFESNFIPTLKIISRQFQCRVVNVLHLICLRTHSLSVQLGDASTNYVLHLSTPLRGNLSVPGSTLDPFYLVCRNLKNFLIAVKIQWNKGKPFTTIDRDNDDFSEGNCAIMRNFG